MLIKPKIVRNPYYPIPMREHVKSLGKLEPNKKVRIPPAVDQYFLAWIDQMTEKGVFANEATPYIELQLD